MYHTKGVERWEPRTWQPRENCIPNSLRSHIASCPPRAVYDLLRSTPQQLAKSHHKLPASSSLRLAQVHFPKRTPDNKPICRMSAQAFVRAHNVMVALCADHKCFSLPFNINPLAMLVCSQWVNATRVVLSANGRMATQGQHRMH